MIKFVKIDNCECTQCGNELGKEMYLMKVSSNSNSPIGYANLCSDCRKSLIRTLMSITPDVEPPVEPHGGKWFTIWKEDKEGIIATMYKNLSADLDAGYSYSGQSIQHQLSAIEEYKDQYNKELDQFVTMSDGEVSKWCYYDLKKRGAI